MKAKIQIKMKISEKALKKIDTPIIVSELIRVTGKSYFTIRRWITENNERLTMKNCLQVIGKETGLSEKEIFEQETEKA